MSEIGFETIGLSLPVRGAWIEIPSISMVSSRIRSLPVRGAWIEMRRVCA